MSVSSRECDAQTFWNKKILHIIVVLRRSFGQVEFRVRYQDRECVLCDGDSVQRKAISEPGDNTQHIRMSIVIL